MVCSLTVNATVVYTHSGTFSLNSEFVRDTNLVRSNGGASNGGLVEPPVYVTGLEVQSSVDNSLIKNGVTLNTETGFLRMTLQTQIETLHAFESQPLANNNITGNFFENLRAEGSGTVTTKAKLHGDWTFNTGFDLDFTSVLRADVVTQNNDGSDQRVRYEDPFSLKDPQRTPLPKVGEINDILELTFNVLDGDVINWGFGWTASLFNNRDKDLSFGNNLFDLGDTIQFGAFELSEGLSLVADDPSFLASATNFLIVPDPVDPVPRVHAPSTILIGLIGFVVLFRTQNGNQS